MRSVVETPSAAAGDRHGWQAYVVRLDRRDEALAGLRAQGIEAQIGTYALHRLSAYRDQGSFPGADRAFERALALPFHTSLTECGPRPRGRGAGPVRGLRVGFADRIAPRYTQRMAQLVTRIDEELLAAVDALVEEGVVPSRSEAVRRALQELLDRQRRRQTAESIVAGYTRLPQTEDEIGWRDEATARMIADEPW